ncbi:MAG: lytic transglycosylase domain-containing protein [Hyphomicrobiaceae bacterium]
MAARPTPRKPWRTPLASIVLFAATVVAPATAEAANCGNTGAGFSAWLEHIKGVAASKGISQRAISAGTAGLTYDANIIRLDRNQKSFKLSFDQFYARRVGPALLSKGRRLMVQHKSTLDRMEKRFGVAREVVIAIWGLETNYGSDGAGGRSILRSLATLAYDCRRSEFFTGQFLDGLRIIDRGDMTAEQLRGGWAGEIGQTQFLPTAYVRYAVDFDGDGRRDLVNSVPDILASTANFLAAHGWKRGQPWDEGTANHEVLRDWNRAGVYRQTIAKMASILAR